jgi:dihydropyrimidine dehydrogenase (NAD+) subunit PreT
LVYDSCPLGATCGLACPTTVLCEGACTLMHMGQTPIRIGSLQSYVSMEYGVPETPVRGDAPARIAVIGGGPSGLGCAIQLSRLGHIVRVFEHSDSLTGLVNRVIPAHRLPHRAIQADLSRLKGSGIEFHLGFRVDPGAARTLVNEHDAVFVGVGMAGTRLLRIPGTEASGVFLALDFLDEARRHALEKARRPDVGHCAVVVGGGNVALDAAIVGSRLGADRVIVLYRRSKDEMPAWETEYLEAASLGVEFRWLSEVRRIITNRGKVAGVQVGAMRFVDQRANGRRWVESDPSVASYELRCDSVILALGQTVDQALPAGLGLAVTDAGTIAVDLETFQTGTEKIFAAGEAVSGGSSIVHAMSQGMAAAHAIQCWLGAGGGNNE